LIQQEDALRFILPEACFCPLGICLPPGDGRLNRLLLEDQVINAVEGMRERSALEIIGKIDTASSVTPSPKNPCHYRQLLASVHELVHIMVEVNQ
jgi:hypothetical protein